MSCSEIGQISCFWGQKWGFFGHSGVKMPLTNKQTIQNKRNKLQINITFAKQESITGPVHIKAKKLFFWGGVEMTHPPHFCEILLNWLLNIQKCEPFLRNPPSLQLKTIFVKFLSHWKTCRDHSESQYPHDSMRILLTKESVSRRFHEN